MGAREYEQLIIEGIRDLPEAALEEIAELILVLRRKFFSPEEFKDELRAALLRAEVSRMGKDELRHLESEFQEYDRRYPRE